MEIDNIDRMFNCFDSKEQYDRQRQKQGSDARLRELEARIVIQEKLLDLCYRKFRKSQLIRRVAAAYEMRSVYGNYCPLCGLVRCGSISLLPGRENIPPDN